MVPELRVEPTTFGTAAVRSECFSITLQFKNNQFYKK
jgi:hypothetical protein